MPATDEMTPKAKKRWSGLKLSPGMDDAEFTRWADLLEEKTGMSLPVERKSFLETSVHMRMQEAGYDDYGRYFDYLFSGLEGKIEWEHLVDRLTVHETRFYRHPASLEFLQKDFLPGLFRQKPGIKSIQCWSVGCATGEEPYTLAMVLDYYLQSNNLSCGYGVTATDISFPSLAIGKQGIYTERRLMQLPDELHKAYINPVEANHYQVNDSLRKRVCFAHLNVREIEQFPMGDMDLIFCQNLLIYFEQSRRVAIINGLVDRLNENGVLVLGAGEMLGWSHPEMEKVKNPKVLAFNKRAGKQG